MTLPVCVTTVTLISSYYFYFVLGRIIRDKTLIRSKFRALNTVSNQEKRCVSVYVYYNVNLSFTLGARRKKSKGGTRSGEESSG